MKSSPKVVYITAGAGGMYCGSCIRDNSLVSGLEELGWDTLLLPLYTPIRTDEEDHSVDQVFFGGINVYLQQKIPLFRHLPNFLDRWLDNPKLIKRVASRSISVSAADLGAMTLSMVKGEHGYQKKEVGRLVHWLKEVVKPDLICLTNLLVGGCIPALKRELGVPVLVTLQGDDVFLDELQEPWREQVLAEMKQLAAAADGFLTFSNFYQSRMSEILEIPAEKFSLTPLGVHGAEFATVREKRAKRESGQTIGYFARLAPEKGFDVMVDAFIELAPRFPEATLRVAGWLSEKDNDFYAEQLAKIESVGLNDRFTHVEAPDGEAKLDFLSELDAFSVPARFVEPKGLYALEAIACGIPFVAPDRGIFPELVGQCGAGVLCEPENPKSLADSLGKLLEDREGVGRMAENGFKWLQENGSREAMAKATAEVFERVLAND
ncbi:glycosyltransferase family 4 protein [Verrucomicrobiales bacterium]|nr:glycosyltransferase family 4 protein [Verrucomicrobiales bacterium]MDC3352761.1 glycosyltransferase family 4 protein [Verrucomicrobiales bacterium]